MTAAKSTKWSWTAASWENSARGGKQLKEFMAVHELDCRTDNQILAGEISNWRVQKLVLHSPAGK